MAKSELELRVDERTAELKRVNEDLVLEIDRRQAIEQNLRDSEEQLRLAQEASGVGVWDWDTRSDRVEWSDQTFRIFGLQPSEQKLDESSILTLIHPEDRAAVKLAIRGALRPGGEFDAEYRIQRPDGSMGWVLAQGRTHCDSEGSPTRMIGPVPGLHGTPPGGGRTAAKRRAISPLGGRYLRLCHLYAGRGRIR